MFFSGTAGPARRPLSKITRGALYLVEADGCEPGDPLFSAIPKAVGQAISLLISDKYVNLTFLCCFSSERAFQSSRGPILLN